MTHQRMTDLEIKEKFATELKGFNGKLVGDYQGFQLYDGSDLNRRGKLVLKEDDMIRGVVEVSYPPDKEICLLINPLRMEGYGPMINFITAPGYGKVFMSMLENYFWKDLGYDSSRVEAWHYIAPFFYKLGYLTTYTDLSIVYYMEKPLGIGSISRNLERARDEIYWDPDDSIIGFYISEAERVAKKLGLDATEEIEGVRGELLDFQMNNYLKKQIEANLDILKQLPKAELLA